MTAKQAAKHIADRQPKFLVNTTESMMVQSQLPMGLAHGKVALHIVA